AGWSVYVAPTHRPPRALSRPSRSARRGERRESAEASSTDVELVPALREVDANGVGSPRVECVHERVLTAGVERVDPTAVARDDASIGIPAHDALPGRLVDDDLREQPSTAEVVGPDPVRPRILP